MAQFNLADYETVEQRIARFYGDHPDGRIITENLTTLQDRQVSTWVVKATIYLNESDIAKATGLAFEVDGTGMANKTSALENAETSAIGRALANAGYSGNKRTSREEMEKVARGQTPKPATDWIDRASKAKTTEQLEQVFNEARQAKVSAETLEQIKAFKANVKD